MAVGLSTTPLLEPVAGVRLGTVAAGIKYPNRADLVVMELAPGTHTAAVFTQNAFCAAPVVVAREHLARTAPRYLLINTGYANAGTGVAGLGDARACCQAVAAEMGCQTEEVLPFSTGVIGEPLPVDTITAALPAAHGALTDSGWLEAARGIMTTDTVPKGCSRQLIVAGRKVTVTGMAKGAGMIRPDMATMLAFVTTDAAVERHALQACLNYTMDHSFHRITVDGDTSTNDACVLSATGAAGNPELRAGDPELGSLAEAVQAVSQTLAQAIVRDGEGATKLITVTVEAAASLQEAREVAFTVAHSPLVKTACFAGDPNWGRILAAVGRAGIRDLDIDKVAIYLGEICLVRGGGRADSYQESQGRAVMGQDEITIRVDLGRGVDSYRVWTCDFSYDYVRINAEYRT